MLNFFLNILVLFCLRAIPSYAWHWHDIQIMTLEEKVGQLLMVHFHGEIANDEAKILVQDIGVGGIIYYQWANGLNSPEQVQQLSAGLQALALKNRLSIPLFIAADQEGGIVARLNKGFTVFPGNQALGETNHPKLAEMAALATGKEMHAVGVNMNFAPVIDVNINPRNPIIGIRSFGNHPEKVALFGSHALEGFKQAKIIASLKHFPGHGDVEIDSHEDLPIINKSMQELEKIELLPFAKLAPSADVVMTAHLLVPALDSENCSTLSEKTLNYLKNDLGFQGTIITDSLVMEGVLKSCQTVDEAAIRALNAGCDIILLGGKQLIGGDAQLELGVNDIRRIQRSLVHAIKNGRITEARLNQAVEKVLKLKERYLTDKSSEQHLPLSQCIHTPQHREIARKIASLAIHIISLKPDTISSLNSQKIVVFAPQLLRENIQQTSLLKFGKTTEAFFFATLSPSEEEVKEAMRLAESADVLLACSYNAWKNPSQIHLIQSLLKTKKPFILLILRDPLDASLFPEANLVLITFSPTVPSIQAACDRLIPFGTQIK